MAKKQWLVTGGTGFFGTHMAWRLIEEGIRPILLDKAPIDDPGLVGKVDYICADVRDKAAVSAAVKRCEAVVHAAAALPLEPAKEIWEVTVHGAENVYGAALQHGVRKCVHIGTTAVYGIPRVHPLYEDSLLVPLGPYGEAKCEAEQVGRRLRREGLDLTIIRPKTFIGTGRLGVFQILFDWVQSGKKIPVLGTGKNRYQLLEVTDLVQGVWLSANAKIKGDDYNIGATRFGTVEEDVGALCSHAGNGARVWPVPSEPAKIALRIMERFHMSPLYKWVYETCDHDSFVDTTKLQKQLKWKPKYSNAEMLCNTYDWYLKEGIAMASRSGTTHRVAWKQGLLGLVKAFM
ncbi:MAG: NAD(P)-dependent oxidoreductase [candidate division FCPU426 bacterium]